MNILLTNDDSYKSPLYTNLAKLLLKEDWATSVILVPPAQEQSWISTAITVYQNVSHTIIHEDGLEMHTLTGTPSDCCMIGALHLSPVTPDLVISGINFGTNAGSAFNMCSGTLAAARLAALIGIPAVACSALVSEDVRQAWKIKDFELLKQQSTYLEEISFYHLDLLRDCYKKGYFAKHPEFEYMSINSPLNLDNKELVTTSVKDTKFKDLFLKLDERTFRHKFMGFKEDDSLRSKLDNPLPKDLDVIMSGRPSITFFNIGVGDIVPATLSKQVK